MIRGEQAHGQDNWSEAQLQALVLDAAKAVGLMTYHTYDSRRSQPGFPDLVIVGRYGVLYRELKAPKGKLTAEQDRWLRALLATGQDASVWRPEDWPLRIITELKSLGQVQVPKAPPSQEYVRQQLRQKQAIADKKDRARRRAGQL